MIFRARKNLSKMSSAEQKRESLMGPVVTAAGILGFVSFN